MTSKQSRGPAANKTHAADRLRHLRLASETGPRRRTVRVLSFSVERAQIVCDFLRASLDERDWSLHLARPLLYKIYKTGRKAETVLAYRELFSSVKLPEDLRLLLRK